MRTWPLLFLVACGGGTKIVDAGADAGPPPVTDGGGLGSACTTVDQCGGNPLCTTSLACAVEVICAAKVCAPAGGPAASAAAEIGFGISPIPTYLQIYLLSPELVAGGTLTCSALLGGIDGGTLNPLDSTAINALVATYAQSVPSTITGEDIMHFGLDEAASGPDRVLYIEGYFGTQSDGGSELLGRTCTTYSDTDAGIGDGGIALSMNSLW